MNIAMWLLAGGLLGWIGFSLLGYNGDRGVKISIAIGIAGAILGAKVIGPMFGASAAMMGDFNAAALFFAAAIAAAFLFVGNVVHDRWGI